MATHDADAPEAKELERLLGPLLGGALARRGFTALTPVQLAVLDPKLARRDLRVSSQTGSGKTVAIGLAIRAHLAGDAATRGGAARPRALVVVPTRELAKQVEEELAWLFAVLGATVVSVTGGTSTLHERRALGAGPAVVVGTPGRLLDHLRRGGIDPSALGAVVLDEADRMLDLGFREDLLAILAFAPPDHLTHLMSATFPRDVKALADQVQRDPAHVEGTPLGTANADIDHVIHVVEPRQRVDALVNLLLAAPDAQTLVFARTRADVARIAHELSEAGFHVGSLSGEMEQPERNRALAAFKRGSLHALVATDVAARGIDVQDIARVVHAEPPDDADTYTHRSGRTGRAGRKGVSLLLVAPSGVQRASQLLRRAGIRARVEPLPTAAAIRAAGDQRLFDELTAPPADGESIDPSTRALAERIAAAGDATGALARLLDRARRAGPADPREVRVIEPPREVSRTPTHAYDRAAPPRAPREERRDGWVPYRVSWGRDQGADPRRLLALVCRRGNVRGADVGAIRIARSYAVVQIASPVAREFGVAAAAPDPREPHVIIRKDDAPPVARPAPAAIPADRPSRARAAKRVDAPRAPHAPRGGRRP